jgi:pimeloyl-ACP methyl ester carboxylesterase
VSLLGHRGGAGPPLVLLHGLGLDWRCWRPVLPALEREHDVLALDLPGFGAAAPLPRGTPPTPARLADAVEAELDALGIPPAVLVGNSLGGWVALELARRGRAVRVVALSPAGLEAPPGRAYLLAINEAMRLRARALAPLGRLATATSAGRVFALAGLRARPWRVGSREAAEDVATFAHAPAFHSTLLATTTGAVPAGLDEIRVPVRIAVGRLDVLLGVWTAPRFSTLLPDAEIVGLRRAGHVPMHDDPEAVARVILRPPPPAA